MLKTRIAIIILLVGGFIGFHLVERRVNQVSARAVDIIHSLRRKMLATSSDTPKSNRGKSYISSRGSCRSVTTALERTARLAPQAQEPDDDQTLLLMAVEKAE